MKIAHFSDIHIRPQSRHEEYKIVFKELINKIKQDNVECIFIGGDVYHLKTQSISPEFIDLLVWWLSELANIANVHIILGNHDGNLQNLSRQDAISPIVFAMNNPKIHLYKNSGVYKIKDGYNLCVFSIFDEENWDKVSPIDGEFNIACYHGQISGCKMDNGQEMHDGLSISFFQPYDLVLLGDIHRAQYLDFREYELEIEEEDLKHYPYAEIIKE